MAKRHEGPKCQWLSLKEAFTAFVQQDVAYQSAAHIKPLHWYVASRLVIEGGFRPDETRPRPPFDVKREGNGAGYCNIPTLAAAVRDAPYSAG